MPESKRSSTTTRSKPEPREERRPGPVSPEEPGRRIDLRSWRQARRKLSELKLPPDGPREEHGDLEELKSSIGKHGLLVPVLIEPDGTVRGGTRRLRALSELKGEQAEVECIILPAGTDPAVAQLVENVHRKDLTPLEEAKAYRALLDKTGWTQRRLATEMCVSGSHLSRTLNLLRAPPEVQEKLAIGLVSRSAVERAYGLRASIAAPDGNAGGEEGEAAHPVERPVRALSRAERIRERLARNAPVHTRFIETSVRVPRAQLADGVRARVFADRIEVTVMVRDDTHEVFANGKTSNLRSLGVYKAICDTLNSCSRALLDGLRQARRKALILEGEIDE